MHTETITKTLPLALAAMLLAGGCSKSNNQPANNPSQYPAQQGEAAPNPAGQQAMNPEATPPQQPSAVPGQGANTMPPPPPPEGYQGQGNAPATPAAPSDIPAGTHIVVTLGETLSTRTAEAGQRFTATVAAPIIVHGVTLVRAGSNASGTVVDSKSAGKFKGQGTLAIRLDSIRAGGHSYEVSSSTVDRVEQGKGKRTAALTGGGTGLGAIIGGIAGGGRGALIGGLAGAGAGGAGSAFTGNHELEIPAESRLTFRLERTVPLR
jgi:hypothetical protein